MPLDKPKFYNPTLRDAVQKAAPSIESFAAKVDALSFDIKSLESYLLSSPIRQNVVIQSAEFNLQINETDPGTDLASCSKIEEFIGWTTHGERGTWRLVFLRQMSNGTVIVKNGVPFGQPALGEPKIVLERPLIEMPVPERVKAFKALPGLMTKIASIAGMGDLQFPEVTPERRGG